MLFYMCMLFNVHMKHIGEGENRSRQTSGAAHQKHNTHGTIFDRRRTIKESQRFVASS